MLNLYYIIFNEFTVMFHTRSSWNHTLIKESVIIDRHFCIVLNNSWMRVAVELECLQTQVFAVSLLQTDRGTYRRWWGSGCRGSSPSSPPGTQAPSTWLQRYVRTNILTISTKSQKMCYVQHQISIKTTYFRLLKLPENCMILTRNGG